MMKIWLYSRERSSDARSVAPKSLSEAVVENILNTVMPTSAK